jgi:hypothetical protein
MDGAVFTGPATTPAVADMKALRVIKRFETPRLADERWQFGIEVKRRAGAGEGQATATVYVLYNDWERVPGFADLMAMLPAWAAPTFQSRQGGLLRVQYDIAL